MRELKFRSWKKHYGKLRRCVFSPFGLIEYAQKHPEAPVLHNEDVNDIRDFMPNADFIEQYTGLKDKNGKEIYEGDILGDGWDSCFVQWCDKCKQVQIHTIAGCMACLGDIQWYEFATATDVIVVGNIHENPELLEQGNAKD